jgi:hypothetical protein
MVDEQFLQRKIWGGWYVVPKKGGNKCCINQDKQLILGKLKVDEKLFGK